MPAKRCPMCHTATEDRARRCSRCGYEFGQPVEKTLELLRSQLRNARILFWVFVVTTLGALALPIAMLLAGSRTVVIPGAVIWVVLMRRTIKLGTTIAISRESIRTLGGSQAALPKATLRAD